MAGLTRITWIAPWFSNLDSRYLHYLDGDKSFVCDLITSNTHLSKDTSLFHRSLVLEKPSSDLAKYFRTARNVRRRIKAFESDFVFIDFSDSFSWLVLAIVSSWHNKKVFVFHDPYPHNGGKSPNLRLAVLRKFILVKGRSFIVFSEYTAEKLKTSKNAKVLVVPLIADVEAEPLSPTRSIDVPTLALIGRWSEYKGFQDGIETFIHLRQKYLPSAQLHLWCSGVPDNFQLDLPGIVWKSRTKYDWGDLISGFSKIGLVLLPYKEASQSGVQILANQLGVPTLCTPVGGLIEYQDPHLTCLKFDQDAWAKQIVEIFQNLEGYSETARAWSSQKSNKAHIIAVFRSHFLR